MESSSEIPGADVLNTHLEFCAWHYEGNIHKSQRGGIYELKFTKLDWTVKTGVNWG